MSSVCQAAPAPQSQPPGTGSSPTKAALQINSAAPQSPPMNNGQRASAENNHADQAPTPAPPPSGLVQDKIAKPPVVDEGSGNDAAAVPHSNGTETDNGLVHPDTAETPETVGPRAAVAPAPSPSAVSRPDQPNDGVDGEGDGGVPTDGDDAGPTAAAPAPVEPAEAAADPAPSPEKAGAHHRSLDGKIDQLKQIAADSSKAAGEPVADVPAPTDTAEPTPAAEAPPVSAEPAEAVPETPDNAAPVPEAEAKVESEPAISNENSPTTGETPEIEKPEAKPKSTMKLATLTPRRRTREPVSTDGEESPAPKRTREKPKKVETPSDDSTPSGRTSGRNRTKVQPYQSPATDLAIATKTTEKAPEKKSDDKLIVFYKNEFLAVRNSEGGFYVCQTMQNVYRSTKKIKIRWLSQDKAGDPVGEVYKPDFYDVTDIECVLTTLSLQKAKDGGMKLGAAEAARTKSILGRALAVERGEPPPESDVTEEHPDGLDLSLYNDEAQLELKKGGSSGEGRKRSRSKMSTDEDEDEEESDETEDDESDEYSDSKPSRKRSGRTPKRAKTKASKSKSPRGKANSKPSPGDKQPTISAPTTNKTATTPTKAASKKKSVGKSPKNASTPASKSRTPKATKSPAASKTPQSTPSTSGTAKPTRTPRKPPATKK